MKNNEQRINNIIGQLEGVKNMMTSEQDCRAIITQLKAIKSAINSLSNKIITENIDDCVQGLKKKDRDKIGILIEEITKNI